MEQRFLDNFLEQLDKKITRLERYSLISSKEMLNIDDVVLITGLSKKWIYTLTANHELTFYKPNNKTIYFDKKDIVDWLRKNKVLSNSEIDRAATTYVVTGRMEKGGTAL